MHHPNAFAFHIRWGALAALASAVLNAGGISLLFLADSTTADQVTMYIAPLGSVVAWLALLSALAGWVAAAGVGGILYLVLARTGDQPQRIVGLALQFAGVVALLVGLRLVWVFALPPLIATYVVGWRYWLIVTGDNKRKRKNA